ncbi:MAG: mechanosensitive ion channel [Pseudomonadota bacterium]|nr:mechanosensitive ion channel [Pseudomonadota bacterium]
MDALESFDIQALAENAQAFIALYGLKIIAAILIFVIGRWVTKLVTSGVRRAMESREVDPTLVGFTSALVQYALLAFVIIAALGELGIQTASFIAILGAAGLAVGLALQGSLSNFAAGVLIILFRPFKSGDFIDAGGAMGIVEQIHVFHTKMRSADNKAIIVPNSSIMGGNITNFSAKETRRVDLVIGVSYDAYIPDAKKLLREVVESDERVLEDPAVFVAVTELADSSVNFTIRAWVNSADWWPTLCDLTENIKLKLDEAGIGIPYPQMDVHIAKEAS